MPAPPSTDLREAIQSALAAFTEKPLREAATALLGVLGYKSERRLPIDSVGQFCEDLDQNARLTEKERESLVQLESLHLLFQLTDAELSAHGDLFDDPGAVQATKIESYIFFAAELPPGDYTRTALATLVRAVNKPLPMPALVLFRHGSAASLGIIHRRLSKRDAARDVLEKVTLIKDIALADPIRAHIEILNDFSMAKLQDDFGFHSFVSLHEAWQKRLGSYALSNARVIFCWFLVEKRLIPSDIFREHRLRALLKDFQSGTDNPVCASSPGKQTGMSAPPF